MKEVTPENEICKSSAFHRILQRAFSGWFPYDSFRFFHPFYTLQQNALFAQQQGYAPEFRVSQKPVRIDEELGRPIFDVAASASEKPWNQLNLKDENGDFVHLALRDPASLSIQMQEDFKARESKITKPSAQVPVHEDTEAIMDHFTQTMRSIIKREPITTPNATYQLDAVRE